MKYMELQSVIPYIDNGYDVKNGKTSSVSIVVINGYQYAFKRYNKDSIANFSAMETHICDLYENLGDVKYSDMLLFGAFPKYLVRDNQKFCGFLMDAIPKECFNEKKEDRHLGAFYGIEGEVNKYSEKALGEFIKKLGKLISYLHDKGFILGDALNDQNLYVRIVGGDLYPYLIDTDSLCKNVGNPAKTYHSPNFEPPEGVDSPASKASDIFKYCLIALRLFSKPEREYERAGLRIEDEAAKESLRRMANGLGPEFVEMLRKGFSGNPSNRPTITDMIKIYYGKKTIPNEPYGKKILPNDPCPCGSGKKYKFCCYGRNSWDGDESQPQSDNVVDIVTKMLENHDTGSSTTNSSNSEKPFSKMLDEIKVPKVYQSFLVDLACVVSLLLVLCIFKFDINHIIWLIASGIVSWIITYRMDMLSIKSFDSLCEKLTYTFFGVLFFGVLIITFSNTIGIGFLKFIVVNVWTVFPLVTLIFSSIFKIRFMNENGTPANLTKGITRAVVLVLALLSCFILVGLGKQFSGDEDEAAVATDTEMVTPYPDAVTTYPGTGDTAKTKVLEKPHYYVLSAPTDSSTYCFDPCCRQEFDWNLTGNDRNQDVFGVFCEHLEHDPLMAAVCMAYADKELGTSFTGKQYSEIRNSWVKEINDIAREFENNIDAWDAATASFEKLLKESQVSVEDLNGYRIRSFVMTLENGLPEIISSIVHSSSDSMAIKFLVPINGAYKELGFIAPSGFEPIIENLER